MNDVFVVFECYGVVLGECDVLVDLVVCFEMLFLFVVVGEFNFGKSSFFNVFFGVEIFE